MTLVLRYAVRSDVGLLREGNEDSAYAGPRLLAVADGMGGHAAGEVASSLTITSMAKLDSEPPGGDMLAELSSAVAAANTRLQEMIIANPAVEGMGTTLTALFWFDGHAAVCHIGDSRGYLLREGGGPDNTTGIVADVVDPAASRLPPTETPVMAGAAAAVSDPRLSTAATAPGGPGGSFDDLDEHLDGNFTGVYDQHGHPPL